MEQENNMITIFYNMWDRLESWYYEREQRLFKEWLTRQEGYVDEED